MLQASAQAVISKSVIILARDRSSGNVLSRVTDKWSLWALSELAADGPLRFSRLLERVEGVSQKSLIATLRGLERDGLVRR
jgi:DNA-binding HxlR family transcriptional regulator